MYTYKYNFRNTGVIDNHKNILAYILCISVVHHKDVSVDELIFLASEFAGDGDVGPNSGYQKYLDTLMRTWNALDAVDPERDQRRKMLEYPGMPLVTNNKTEEPAVARVGA